jgi:hypothetical protein
VRSRSGRAVTGEVVLLGGRVAAVGPARSLGTASARRSSLSAAPAALSLLPSGDALATSLVKPGHGFDARDAFLIADLVFGLALLGVASLPGRVLANLGLAAAVETRRVELALVGAATVAVAAVAALVT